jgi:predicted dehydrogenase
MSIRYAGSYRKTVKSIGTRKNYQLDKTDVRFAIVGCGLIGQKRFSALPHGSLTATCDLIPQRATDLARQAGPGCLATTSLEQALNTGPDAVIISTLNSELFPVALACLRAGKHILVEKPVATSVAQLDELSTVASTQGLLVRAGYNHRYHAAFQEAHRLCQSQVLGPLMFIRGRYGHGGRLGYEREWRADPKLSGGGELMDQGVHLIDLAGWFLGPWTHIDGHAATYFWDMPVDDNAFLQLRNSEGSMAWLHASCTEWKNLFSFEIYGKHAKLHIEGLGGSYGVERLYVYRMLPEMGPPETIIHEFPRSDQSWAVETLAFVDDIRLHRTPVPGLAEARAALTVVESIYRKSGVTQPSLSLTS